MLRTLLKRARNNFKDMFTKNQIPVLVLRVRDLKVATMTKTTYQVEHFPSEKTNQFKLCNTCYIRNGNRLTFPLMKCSNGYAYQPKQIDLPKLNPQTERFISSRVLYTCRYAANISTESSGKSSMCH